MILQMPGDNKRDRVTRYLTEQGYELDWRCPADGDVLPQLQEQYALAVVYGGVQSANDDTNLPYIGEQIDWIARWVDSGRPYLGLCLGAQLLARALGANVDPHPEGLHEIGFSRITPTGEAGEFLTEPLHVYHWHGEGFEVPDAAELLAVGETFPNQAFRYGDSAYGLQFHAETTPEIFESWIDGSNDALSRPGAHPRERQLADASRFDEKMGSWFVQFLDRLTRHCVTPG